MQVVVAYRCRRRCYRREPLHPQQDGSAQLRRGGDELADQTLPRFRDLHGFRLRVFYDCRGGVMFHWVGQHVDLALRPARRLVVGARL